MEDGKDLKEVASKLILVRTVLMVTAMAFALSSYGAFVYGSYYARNAIINIEPIAKQGVVSLRNKKPRPKPGSRSLGRNRLPSY